LLLKLQDAPWQTQPFASVKAEPRKSAGRAPLKRAIGRCALFATGLALERCAHCHDRIADRFTNHAALQNVLCATNGAE
jgi:hypothetical protein